MLAQESFSWYVFFYKDGRSQPPPKMNSAQTVQSPTEPGKLRTERESATCTTCYYNFQYSLPLALSKGQAMRLPPTKIQETGSPLP
jgi:hypothetical protein